MDNTPPVATGRRQQPCDRFAVCWPFQRDEHGISRLYDTDIPAVFAFLSSPLLPFINKTFIIAVPRPSLAPPAHSFQQRRMLAHTSVSLLRAAPAHNVLCDAFVHAVCAGDALAVYGVAYRACGLFSHVVDRRAISLLARLPVRHAGTLCRIWKDWYIHMRV